MNHKNAFETNKKTWNEKAAIHFESEFYDRHAFAKAALSGVDCARNSLMSYEQKALGDVDGKTLMHL